MERAEWLQQMRQKAQALYDYLAPLYWVRFGLQPNETHREFVGKLLARMAPGSTLLSAGCGAGRYDGMLLEAGHRVIGIDQSAGMLARAQERFPAAHYERLGLQEMSFHEAFDGATCIEALEHVCPEDWPGILQRFHEALKPGGVLYFTVDLAEADHLRTAYQRAQRQGLPVVYGEVVDQVDDAYARVTAAGLQAVSGESSDVAVYHYYPSLEQVRAWIRQAELALEDEGTGNEYEHFLVRKA